jgi:hypothetical protein
MMGRLGGLVQQVSDQAVSATYQALEAATIVYAAVSHRASNENPNGFLVRNNFIWADLTDPRYNEYNANNNTINNPCHLEKYHLGFPFGAMAVGQQFLDHAADIFPTCIVPPVQTTCDESPTQWAMDRIITALSWTIKPATAAITREELNWTIRSYLEARERQSLVFLLRYTAVACLLASMALLLAPALRKLLVVIMKTAMAPVIWVATMMVRLFSFSMANCCSLLWQGFGLV